MDRIGWITVPLFLVTGVMFTVESCAKARTAKACIDAGADWSGQACTMPQRAKR
jgi:hypothetical protein